MKISVSTDSLLNVKADLLAIGVRAGKIAQNPHLQQLDKAMGGALLAQLKDEDFSAERGETLKVPAGGKLSAGWLVFVGLGSDKETARDAVTVAVYGARAARRHRTLAVLPPTDGAAAVRAAAEGAVTGSYRYDTYLTGARKPKYGLKSAVILSKRRTADLGKAADAGRIVGEAINVARDLVNAPPNDLHPTALANTAKSEGTKAGAKVTVWNKRQIESKGMTLLLAVSRGSSQEPRVIHMVYKPARAKKKVAFVGKGLTFDAGGLCLKPAKAMGDMKCDMAGAATTIGIVLAAARLKLPVEVHGIVGSTENMLGADAYRPGDVFPSLEGKTVEIVNTDAEGRLVLADVLTYAAGLKPDYMIDHATLTGACMVALGKWRAGMYANDEDLRAKYQAAAETVDEAYWNMPLDEDLRELLKSDVADLKHIGDSHGGSISAALFLSEFIGNTKWIHCDIAGPAFLEAGHRIHPKGGTGFGVSTGVAFLEGLAGR